MIAAAHDLQRAVVADGALVAAAGPAPEPGATLFLGTGLTTRNELGEGLAFDVLALVFAADDLRKRFGLKRVLHLIADVHAKANAFVDPRAVARLAAQAEIELHAVCAAFGVADYDIVKGSEVLAEAEYAQIFDAVPTRFRRYERLEIADIEWARRRGAGLKLGWAMSADLGDARGFDERRFDMAHSEVFGDGMAYVYAEPGRSDNPEHPRVSPYVRLSSHRRPGLIADDEPLPEPDSRSMRRHLEAITARAETRIPGALPEQLPERILRLQRLIGRAMEGIPLRPTPARVPAPADS